MKAILIGKNEIFKITLPKYPRGSYWITSKRSDGKEKKLLNIEGNGNNWQIYNNRLSHVIDRTNIDIEENRIHIINEDNNIIRKKSTIEEYGIYFISIGTKKELYILYCAPVYETDFRQIHINNNREILIGSDEKCHIIYKNDLVSKVHAKISYSNGRWIIENKDKKIGTFVNDRPVSKDIRVLLNGDIVFIMGLRIIIMGNDLFINNPLNQVSYNSEVFVSKNINNEEKTLVEEEANDEDIYTESDYYYRAPRIKNKIEREEVKIDPPPASQNQEEMPAILVIGSTLSMGAVMIVSMVNSLEGLSKGMESSKETVISLIISFLTLIAMLLFPVLEMKWQKRQKIKYEEKRQKRYKEYIDKKIKEIDGIMIRQRNALFQNYSSAEECSRIILTRNKRLWERTIEDYDFLSVRLGTGDTPSDIEIQYPEQQFTMEDDNLVDILNTVANKSKLLKNVPIVLSLTEKKIVGIISKNAEGQQRFFYDIILQLITFQSYGDLKLVFLLSKDSEKKWEHFKMLPHIWSNIKDIRFFSNDRGEMQDISRYLEEVLQSRYEFSKDNDVNYKTFSPYYLIITDDYKSIEKLSVIKEVLRIKENLGFGMLCLADNIVKLPSECKLFINLEDGEGSIYESEMTSKLQKKFIFDDTQRIFFERILRVISNIPIRYTSGKDMMLPNTYTFLEMYDVGTIEQLNIINRWESNDSTRSLSAPIGIDSTGNIISLDIHEKFHGPHGLIAGATGSGKSEFIITYILSLALNFHPDDVAFILIDYKGGGLAGAFQKRDAILPHLVGTITNIDTVGLQRSLASIKSELRRRQIMFNEARNMTDEGTIDIYKYQKLYHEGVVSKAIPHLLIICDEFAELKQQQEDFMDELISVARIGRSLGVHLILATQKPAGIVSDQIQSNSKFGICLKVQDEGDSYDVIKKPDAAYLKNAGQFYLQVGNDEYFVLGQSAWSGADYIPSDTAKKKEDKSIEFLSNMGTVIKKIDDDNKKVENNEGEQLTNIVQYMSKLAKEKGIKSEKLWLENIPETIYIKDIKKKYNIKPKQYEISPTIGEYDDPANQSQGVVQLNLSKSGNTIIYGSADSGKETLLNAIVYDIMTTYSPNEAQMYLMDFGSEALKIFRNSPSVGDVMFAGEDEKIQRYFDMIEKEIRLRKSLLSEYNGDYNLYLNTSGQNMPMIINIINGYEAFSEMYEDKYDDQILSLSREGIKCGIVFILTATNGNDIRYRLSQNFKKKLTLQLNNDDEYFNIFDNVGKKRPSRIFGRGLISLDNEEIYEFQTAKICDPEKWNVYIKEQINELIERREDKAKPVPVLPKKVSLDMIKDELTDMHSLPLGISREELNIYKYDFTKRKATVITSKNLEDSVNYVIHLIEEINMIENIELLILDEERVIKQKKDEVQKDYANLLIKTKIKNKDVLVCIIIGVDKFISGLDDGETEFQEMLEKTEDKENVIFIFVDNATKIKNHEYDDWYKDYITGEDGIWVGNGVDDQYVFEINSNGELSNNCGVSFGYAIKNGIPSMIKLLGIKEKGDDDE